MRHTPAVFISTGVVLAGLLVAACGATHSATSTTVRTRPVPAANAAAHPRIVFLSPRAGARVGATVHVRVRRSEAGRVRFILDGHRDQVTVAAGTVYRHLAPGRHRLQAELLIASGRTSAATAVIRFRVRRPPPPPPPPAVATVPAPAPPVVTQTAPPPPAAPPAPAPAQTQTTMTAPPPPTGIPQNGGGDDDSDNHGAPSDGDGNI